MYWIEMDENFRLFLVCVGYEYHLQECKICDTTGPDVCIDGGKMLSLFADGLKEWHESVLVIKGKQVA